MKPGREVTIKGFDATGKVVTETVRVIPRRRWYEHAGAELCALNAGLIVAALCMHFGRLEWWVVLVAGIVGFVIACVTVFVGAFVEATRKLDRVKSIEYKHDPIAHPDVPSEHKRSR